MKRDVPSYRGYRFPPESISHAVWLYHRFGVGIVKLRLTAGLNAQHDGFATS